MPCRKKVTPARMRRMPTMFSKVFISAPENLRDYTRSRTQHLLMLPKVWRLSSPSTPCDIIEHPFLNSVPKNIDYGLQITSTFYTDGRPARSDPRTRGRSPRWKGPPGP